MPKNRQKITEKRQAVIEMNSTVETVNRLRHDAGNLEKDVNHVSALVSN